MFTLNLTESVDVGFAADSIYVDKRGIVWALLMNGMLASYDPSTNEKEVSTFRTMSGAWSGDQAILVVESCRLVSYDLTSRQAIAHLGGKGVGGPICIGAKGNLFLCNGGKVFELSSSGAASQPFRVDYEIMSIAVARNEVWVGGDGLDRFNLTTMQLENIDSERNLPILQIAFDPEANIVATAGGALCLYDNRGELLGEFGMSYFRCQFSRSNVLFTCTQEGNMDVPLNWSFRQEFGVNVCEFSDCTGFLCYGEVGNEKVIVSRDGLLYFFDCFFDDV